MPTPDTHTAPDPRGVPAATGHHGDRADGVDPRLLEFVAVPQATADGMLEAEHALSVLRDRAELTASPEARAELAAEALDQVESQLALVRDRRKDLDGIEGRLWARRNRLERILIAARGRDWWRAHRESGRRVGAV